MTNMLIAFKAKLERHLVRPRHPHNQSQKRHWLKQTVQRPVHSAR
jgi:hypothetical protein